MARTVADQMVDTLAAAGVSRIYGASHRRSGRLSAARSDPLSGDGGFTTPMDDLLSLVELKPERPATARARTP